MQGRPGESLLGSPSRPELVDSEPPSRQVPFMWVGWGCLAVASFAAVTLAALEGPEVAVLHTRSPTGEPRRTRTWIAQDGGDLLVEAANPERPFLLDLRRRPQLDVDTDSGRHHCRGEVLPNPGGHQRVRRLLRQRYGWADWWIAWFADTRGSLAVRLVCDSR